MVGVFFGLDAAYDLVSDATVQASAASLASRIANYVASHQWSPNDDPSSTFQLRPEELQMLLQVTRHLNPSSTISGPFFVLPVSTAVAVDSLSLTPTSSSTSTT